jgi:hypothetical protein
MPSIRQGPLPRGALSSVRLRPAPATRFGHREAGSRRLFTNMSFEPVGRATVHALRCHGYALLISLGDARRLLQPEYDARAHPNEPSILAREWSSRSAARRHQPMPVALAFRCVAAPRPASHDLPEQAAGRNAREKAIRFSRTMSRVPSSWRSGPPGRRRDCSRGVDPRALSLRPRSISDAASRKASTVGRIEVPSAATEPLRDREV